MMRKVMMLSLLAGCGLPSFPVETLQKPAPSTFTGAGRCRVAVEPLVFDDGTRWFDKSEAELVASLRPEAQKSHADDKLVSAQMYTQNIDVNARDYVGDRGSVTGKPKGDEPFVVRSRVVGWDGKQKLEVIHSIFGGAEKVAELHVFTQGLGYGLGMQLRAAAIGQAWTLLKYLGDHFACNGPARAAD